MTALELPLGPRRGRGDAGRWLLALLAAAALHAAALVALLAWPRPIAAPPPPEAILLDLAPPPAPAAALPEPEPPPPVEFPPAPPLIIPEPPVEPPPPELAPEPTVAPLRPPPRKPREHRPQPHSAEHPPPPVPTPAAPAAPVLPPAPTAPSVSAAATPDALTAFERMLSAHLERQKRYPRTAQIRGEEGEVQLRFVMERSGKVLEAHLERGSGHRDLDAEALALLRRAEPLPPFPPELAEGVHEWLVPIRFRLR